MPMKYTFLARYGAMRQIGTFSSDIRLRLGDRCLLRSERGTEWGEILSAPRQTDGQPPPKADGFIIRRPTGKDHEQQDQIERVDQQKEFALCAAKIAERNLPMRLACVEHIFGGEKIIFYFLAEGRVDFRQLVKDLATEYRTRIELRQIGVRDEARLLAEYEHCGRELCCRTFMRDLEPVTMRMAKLQKTTLDPTKISGRCGRLMCCLRFEDETYADLKSNLPRKGTRVRIAQGVGEVVASEVLAQTVTVELPDAKSVVVPMSEVLEQLPEDRTEGGEERRATSEERVRVRSEEVPRRPRRPSEPPRRPSEPPRRPSEPPRRPSEPPRGPSEPQRGPSGASRPQQRAPRPEPPAEPPDEVVDEEALEVPAPPSPMELEPGEPKPTPEEPVRPEDAEPPKPREAPGQLRPPKVPERERPTRQDDWPAEEWWEDEPEEA